MTMAKRIIQKFSDFEEGKWVDGRFKKGFGSTSQRTAWG